MKEQTPGKVTATELARNLATSIDRVRISGRSLFITKDKRIVAELRPPPRAGFPVSELPSLLISLPKLGKEDSKQMAKDLDKTRKLATLPASPWD